MPESIRVRAISARDVHRKERDRGRGDFRNPGIREAQVSGNPGEWYGEQACAWVVPHEGAWPTPEDVIASAIVAVCCVAGEDVNASMVSQGWAVAYGRGEGCSSRHLAGRVRPTFSRRRGERLQADARTDGAEWRIKGNISRRGTRINYVPDGQSYPKNRIDISEAQRWFRTKAEAGAAGWRWATR